MMYALKRAVAAILALTAITFLISSCSDEHFNVGDCVTAKMSIGNDEIKKADCKKSTIQERLGDDAVYKVSKVVDLDGRCPSSTDVRFRDEPAKATYCLVYY